MNDFINTSFGPSPIGEIKTLLKFKLIAYEMLKHHNLVNDEECYDVDKLVEIADEFLNNGLKEKIKESMGGLSYIQPVHLPFNMEKTND